MAQSKKTQLMKSDLPTHQSTKQDKVAQALSNASKQAKKQLTAQGLKLPTQNWTGSAVRNPATWSVILNSIYFENDDILQICVSEKQMVRKVSQDWHTNISYAEDGSIVEIVLLDAKKEGLLPLEYRKAAWSVWMDFLLKA